MCSYTPIIHYRNVQNKHKTLIISCLIDFSVYICVVIHDLRGL